jgi:hypothetical protein
VYTHRPPAVIAALQPVAGGLVVLEELDVELVFDVDPDAVLVVDSVFVAELSPSPDETVEVTELTAVVTGVGDPGDVSAKAAWLGPSASSAGTARQPAPATNRLTRPLRLGIPHLHVLGSRMDFRVPNLIPRLVDLLRSACGFLRQFLRSDCGSAINTPSSASM